MEIPTTNPPRNMENINDKIRIKQTEISVEDNPNKRAILRGELEILQLRKQIEHARKLNDARKRGFKK